MLELLKNAWSGWSEFTYAGKYTILLIVVLMFFWFRKEECKEKILLIYTTVMTICCIVPVSAAVLMAYQTRFYDYEWIWNYVPQTLMLAYGAVVFHEWVCEHCRKNSNNPGKWNRFITVGVAVLVITLFFLSGRLGQDMPGDVVDSGEQQKAENILNMLVETADGQEICLWAPQEIVDYVRENHADIRLIYGKDMWTLALAAYTYEPYGETEQMLYQWMINAAEKGKVAFKNEEGKKIKGLNCMKKAKKAGVNRILIPDSVEKESVEKWAKKIKAELQEIEGYYLFVL